jgi:hypothetical protein
MALTAAHLRLAVWRLTQIVLKALQAVWWMLVPEGYRPELHYMRGPGPRTRKAGKATRR